MTVLTSQQRSTLETAVTKARKLAEVGAFNALHSMAIDHPEPFAHMDAGQRALRNNLRGKARLLGDELLSNSEQKIEHLSYELAYENWHKMLFAKFLEVNNLLMHPGGVAVTLSDCEELASEEGYIDKWDAAASYASRMLPAIFRVADPLMQVPFATNDRIKLEEIIDSLEEEIFTASDALGWVYQFWQSDAKAAINASGDKIDGAKLPAVTQLFTEPYMVHFLIDNTIGAWWVSRNPGVTPPVKFEYLRYLPSTNESVTEPGRNVSVTEPGRNVSVTEPGRSVSVTEPSVTEPVEAVEVVEVAAGTFEGWPATVAGTLPSPQGEGAGGEVISSGEGAGGEVLTVLDPCMGSGHFIVSLFSVLAPLRMYEEGISKEEATDRVITENLHGLEIDPRCTQIAAFNLALTAWKFCGYYRELPEMNLACSGIAPKGKVEDWVKLVDKVADPVDRERMENGMRALYNHFQLAPELGSLLDPSTIKADAFTASFEQLEPVLAKALEGEADKDLIERGVMAAGIAKVGNLLGRRYNWIITNVPFLGRGKFTDFLMKFSEINYSKSKNELGTIFIERSLKLLATNGFLSFVSPQNWLFPNNYIQFRRELILKNKLAFIARLGTRAFVTISGEVVNVGLFGFFNCSPKETDMFFGIDVSNEKNPIEKANALKSEYPRMITQKSQLENNESRITLTENTRLSLVGNYAKAFEGSSTGDKDRFLCNFWEITFPNLEFEFFQFSSDQNTFNSGNNGCIRWQQGIGILSKYSGARIQGLNAFKKRGILVGRVGDIKIGYYSKQFFDKSCVAIIPKNEDVLDSLFCFFSSSEFVNSVNSLDPRLSVATTVFEKIPFDLEYWQKVAKEKYPNGLPKPYSDDATQWLFHGHPIKAENLLQVAIARLLGYRWPAETDTEMELANEARELIQSIKAFDHLTDEDGIFCIPSVNAEQAGADRIREFLHEVFKEEWNNKTIEQLLAKEGAKSTNLEQWLRDEFFIQHCKLFQNRPFIWHIWDGRKDGFSVLVNYHKLNKENFSKLIYTYLGDWIRMCDSKKKAEESGAEGLLSAALKLKEKLETILNGEAPFDIFVRWKPIEQQPIGWEPDLNDGVRLNIRPFVEAGVLRSKFNIKWGIDRGKNPPGSSWGEIRDNDTHLSLEQKRIARENKQ